MKAVKILVATAALAASVGASAQVVGSLGGGYGTFLTMTSTAFNTAACGAGATCSIGGYSVLGGTVYNADFSAFAALPPGTNTPSAFLAAGPSSTSPSAINFGAGIPYISFLWGSPDTYNLLTVTTTAGSQTFSVDGGQVGSTSLGFSTTNGDQSIATYVQFLAQGTSLITGLSFNNIPSINAFEVANFSVTAAVPEPETYALILAGLGALGFITRRRRNQA